MAEQEVQQIHLPPDFEQRGEEVQQIHLLPDAEQGGEEVQRSQHGPGQQAKEETVKLVEQALEEELEVEEMDGEEREVEEVEEEVEPTVEEVERIVVVETPTEDESEEPEQPETEEVEKLPVEEVENPVVVETPAELDPEDESEDEEPEQPAVEEVEEREKPGVEEVVKPAVVEEVQQPPHAPGRPAEEEETVKPVEQESEEELEVEEQESEEEPEVEEIEEEEPEVEKVDKLVVVETPAELDPDDESEDEEPEQPAVVKPAVEEEEEEEEEVVIPAVVEAEKPVVVVEVVKPAVEEEEEEEEVVKPAVEEEEEEEVVIPAVVEAEKPVVVEEVVKPAMEQEVEILMEQKVDKLVELQPPVEKLVVEELVIPAAVVEEVEEAEKPAVEEVMKPAMEQEVEILMEQKVDKLVELQPPVEKPAELPAEEPPAACENSAAAAEQALEQEEAAPGSLAFPFLEEESTEAALRETRTLYILLGLPGAGKSRLAAAIRHRYQDSCAVVFADDHGVRPERYAPDGHKALDEAVASCCASGRVAVVVDDTNHTGERLARLGELAEEHRYLPLYLEPRTPWRRDVDQLPGRTHRGLDKGQIQALKASLEAVCYPLYFGWFLSHSFRGELEGLAKGLLKTLESLEAFKEHLSDFTPEGAGLVAVTPEGAGPAAVTPEGAAPVDLEQYFRREGPLHCTTKFCDYGKADGAKEYAESQVVQQRLGSVTELHLQALFVTPRTLGARVVLTPEQLQLWPGDGEEEAAVSGLAPGGRAHVTLGCARGAEPAQTGPDLLKILQLQQEGREPRHAEDLELGPLGYYGDGVWVLSLSEPRVGPALFSCFHGRRKTEDLRKKKPKCTLL